MCMYAFLCLLGCMYVYTYVPKYVVWRPEGNVEQTFFFLCGYRGRKPGLPGSAAGSLPTDPPHWLPTLVV